MAYAVPTVRDPPLLPAFGILFGSNSECMLEIALILTEYDPMYETSPTASWSSSHLCHGSHRGEP
jgi:hypothetical protein